MESGLAQGILNTRRESKNGPFFEMREILLSKKGPVYENPSP